MKGRGARRKKSMQLQAAEEGDRISELPREILASIICRLTLREATATSVLSSRWRNLHTYFPRLCYLPPFDDSYLTHEKKLRNYMNVLNHKLDSYKGGTNLKEFRLRMPRLDRAKADLDRWFGFALAREVEIVSVHMVPVYHAPCGSYTLPIPTLIRNCRRRSPPAALRTLKKLSLSGMNMDDKDVPFLLSSFVALERLSIANCGRGLKNVSVVGPLTASKLKQLDISDSWDIQSLEVCHVATLVSLTCYRVPNLNVLRLVDVPKLADLTACGQPASYHATGVLHFMPHSVVHQLLHLKLSTGFHTNYELTFRSTNIRHLELEFEMENDVGGLYELSPLLRACPLLEILNMKFSWDRNSAKLKHREQRSIADTICSWTEEKEYYPRKPNHPLLKQVTLSGYFGSRPELEFAKCVIDNADVALQDLTVEPCSHLNAQIQREATARAHRHFPPITPPSVNLLIRSYYA